MATSQPNQERQCVNVCHIAYAMAKRGRVWLTWYDFADSGCIAHVTDMRTSQYVREDKIEMGKWEAPGKGKTEKKKRKKKSNQIIAGGDEPMLNSGSSFPFFF
jgi:hypothetical protein